MKIKLPPLSVLAAVAVLAAPLAAIASDNPLTHRIGSGQLSGVALNAAAASRTVTIYLADLPSGRNSRGWGKLLFGVQYTYSAASAVTAQFTCSYDGTTYYRRTTRSCSSGTCTLYEQTDSNPVSASQDFEIEYDVRGCAAVKILLAGTGAGAGDLVTTQAVIVAGE